MIGSFHWCLDMSEQGLLRLLQACENLKYGIENAVDESNKTTLHTALGRILDTARDNRTYNQEDITKYVVWLMKYRIARTAEQIKASREADSYGTRNS